MAESAPASEVAAGTQRRMQRQMGTVGVLFASVGVVIGSGWLFGAYNASKIAGPGSLLAWLIGGLATRCHGPQRRRIGRDAPPRRR